MINNSVGRTNNRNMDNFNLNREISIYNRNNSFQILDDRDLFNKFSNNNNDIIDTTPLNIDNNFGMPVYGGSTINNKKNLLSTPFIHENNEKNNFKSLDCMDNNDSYAELEFDIKNKNKNNNNLLDNMAYNNFNNDSINNYICKIEKDSLDFEYQLNKNKNKDIVVDINSPFAIAYIWKTLILLSKNPSTNKLLESLGIKNKDLIINDMKKHADVFDDCGIIDIIIPSFNSSNVLNVNFINKIKDIYKINIKTDENILDNIVYLNLQYIFELEIPFYYQPKIIFNYLNGYTKNKIKFIEMTDVPAYLLVDKQNNIVILEIPFSSNMILGFIYSTSLTLLDKIPYEIITTSKKPDHLIKKLIIPKINRNKKTNYSKRFKDILTKIHLGEIIYGSMFEIDINLNIGLNLSVSKDISNDKYDIKNSFDNININHRCYYYIKNKNIPNKILSNGLINY